MKVCLFTAAVLASLAGAVHAQTAPPTPPTSDLTRDLNSGPPVPAAYIAPEPPAIVTPAPTTAAPSTAAPTIAASTVRPAPTASLNPTSSGPIVAPAETAPPRARSIPVTPAPQPRAVPVTPPSSTPARAPTSAPVAAPEPTTPPPPPNVPTVTVLDAAARAALPFSVSLPPGFEIVTGRPGPDFRIYTIRRGGQSFVMVYAGPASQFPIYSGQMVEAGGRASVVSTEDGVRHALEHLFQRPDAPREIHVWTMSLDGADRAMAEGIAQSVDLRQGL